MDQYHTHPGPPVREVTCVVPRCTDCGEDAWDEIEGYSPHFDDVETARDILTRQYQWRITGARWLCRSCGEKAECDRAGHEPQIHDPVTLEDGTTIGMIVVCERCGRVVNSEPPIRLLAPLGYPAPERRQAHLSWDGAAFPRGEAIAAAACTLLAAMNAAAVATRWDAWPGGQSRRPHPPQPSPGEQVAAADLLITTAMELLMPGGKPGGKAA
jgi:hypothetical protein